MLSRRLLIPLANPLLNTSVELISHNHTTYNGSLPTHTTGDLLLGFAKNFTNSNSPSAPSGWSTISSSAFSGFRVAKKTAASAAETASWGTNADIVTYVVLRSHNGTGSTGSASSSNLSNTPMPSGALTVNDGSSFIVQVGHFNISGTAVTIDTSFYQLYTRGDVGGSSGILAVRAGRGTSAPVANYNVSSVATNPYHGWRVEVLS